MMGRDTAVLLASVVFVLNWSSLANSYRYRQVSLGVFFLPFSFSTFPCDKVTLADCLIRENHPQPHLITPNGVIAQVFYAPTSSAPGCYLDLGLSIAGHNAGIGQTANTATPRIIELPTRCCVVFAVAPHTSLLLRVPNSL